MHKITSFVVAEAVRVQKGREVSLAPQVKSAPHYFAKSVPAQHILGQQRQQVDGIDCEVVIKTYHPYAIIASVTAEVENLFGEGTLGLKEKLLELCYQTVQKYGGREEVSEEYTLYQISGYRGDPETLLAGNAATIAGLLKSEKLELHENEVEHTLSFQLRYAKDDLVIIDWDGAFLCDSEGDFAQTLELLELANYQLLRYRILDNSLDEGLKRAYKLTQAQKVRWFRTKEVAQAFKEVIKIRARSIAHFDAVERDIKLIGDWYSARLYELLAKKFRLEDWRGAVREKLESLEDVYSIVSENLGLSRIQVLELIQIGAFFVLQIGWFILIILEFLYFTR